MTATMVMSAVCKVLDNPERHKQRPWSVSVFILGFSIQSFIALVVKLDRNRCLPSLPPPHGICSFTLRERSSQRQPLEPSHNFRSIIHALVSAI